MTIGEERFGEMLFGEQWPQARKDPDAFWRRLYWAVKEVR